MRRCRIVTVLRRRNLPATLVIGLLVTLSLNSYYKVHTSEDVRNGNKIDNKISNTIRRTSNLSSSTEQSSRKLNLRDSRRFLWEYHSPVNGLVERTNALVKANVLIINEQLDSETYNDDNTNDQIINNGINRTVSKVLPSYGSKNDGLPDLNISKMNPAGLPRKHHGNAILRNQGKQVQELMTNQRVGEAELSLIVDGKWQSWPECLCNEGQTVDCSPLTEPSEAQVMEHGSGGTCSWRAWKQSTEKVISVSLYGPPSRHKSNLQSLITGAPSHYPGWSVWVYLRHPNPQELCPLLHSSPHVFFCDARVLPAVGDLKKTSPLMWNVAPLGDGRARAVMVRNLDESPLQREAAAVQEWWLSGKDWHVMRDHPQQTAAVGMGLWGARWADGSRHKMAALRNILLVRAATTLSRTQAAEFLQNVLWPQMSRSRSVMQHDAYRCNETLQGAHRPWPTKRFANTFVGASSDSSDSSSDGPLMDCPEECRPVHHKDWITC